MEVLEQPIEQNIAHDEGESLFLPSSKARIVAPDGDNINDIIVKEIQASDVLKKDIALSDMPDDVVQEIGEVQGQDNRKTRTPKVECEWLISEYLKLNKQLPPDDVLEQHSLNRKKAQGIVKRYAAHEAKELDRQKFDELLLDEVLAVASDSTTLDRCTVKDMIRNAIHNIETRGITVPGKTASEATVTGNLDGSVLYVTSQLIESRTTVLPEIKQQRYDFVKSLMFADVCYTREATFTAWTKKRPGSRSSKYQGPCIKLTATFAPAGLVHYQVHGQGFDVKQYLDNVMAKISKHVVMVFDSAKPEITEWLATHNDVSIKYLPPCSSSIDPCVYAFNDWAMKSRVLSNDVMRATNSIISWEDMIARRTELLIEAMANTSTLMNDGSAYYYQSMKHCLAYAFNM